MDGHDIDLAVEKILSETVNCCEIIAVEPYSVQFHHKHKSITHTHRKPFF